LVWVAALHREHYGSLVRLATLVVGDRGVAEQLTQDAFVKLHLRWGGLRRLDRAPAYLRSAVLNGARSHLRRRKGVERHDARGARCSSIEGQSRGTGGGSYIDAVVAEGQRLDRMRSAIGDGWAMEPRRVGPNGDLRRAIRVRKMVDMVCIQGKKFIYIKNPC
jgi:DNA-directed RNA polymerase specialized sigma24 family protein